MNISLPDLISLLDSLPVFIGVIDADRRYEFVNATYQQRFGLPREEIIGRSVESLNGTTEYRKSICHIDRVLSGHEVEFEYEFNDEHFLLNYLPRVEDDEVTGYFVVSANTTQLKRANRDLEEAKHGLQSTLEEYLRLAGIAHADRLDSLGTMASSVAHEISQPIHAATLYLELLRTLADTKAEDTELLPVVEKIQKSLDYCMEIISRFRQFAGNKKSPRAWLRMDEVVDNAIALVSPLIRENDVELVCDFDRELPSVELDSVEIQQVLVNLICNSLNALKTVDLDSKKIRIDLREKNADVIALRIEDNGPGISSAMTEEGPFTAFKSDTAGGLGVGLFISRSIIQANGGDIEWDETYKDGAAFEVTFPVSRKRQPV